LPILVCHLSQVTLLLSNVCHNHSSTFGFFDSKSHWIHCFMSIRVCPSLSSLYFHCIRSLLRFQVFFTTIFVLHPPFFSRHPSFTSHYKLFDHCWPDRAYISYHLLVRFNRRRRHWAVEMRDTRCRWSPPVSYVSLASHPFLVNDVTQHKCPFFFYCWSRVFFYCWSWDFFRLIKF